jgi:hypothetical protein
VSKLPATAGEAAHRRPRLPGARVGPAGATKADVRCPADSARLRVENQVGIAGDER